MVGIIFGKFFAKDNQVKNKEKDFFCLKIYIIQGLFLPLTH